MFLEKCSIADNDSVGTTKWCSGALYPLAELTENRMVFFNAIVIGDQILVYVFERNYFFSTNF